MPSFRHGEVEIAYLDQSQDLPNAEPIVLVHGFASTKDINWANPSWLTTLTRAGRRVVALDNRGHGQSTKLYDPAAYQMTSMAEDVRALMDHLGIARADVMGYSMGARIAANLAVAHQDRMRSAILGGIGVRIITSKTIGTGIAEALEIDDPAAITDPQGMMFRRFADVTKSDRLALAACIRGGGKRITEQEVASIRIPTLIAVGTKDTLAGSPDELAKLMPHAQVLMIPDRDHMLAVGDKVYKNGVLEFLKGRP
jgi:pimeloyl-ACP methyl ester carboxylesterase